MMNGAAMNCRQDPSIRPPHQDPSSLHNAGYHLQINRQQNLQHQNSKTMNYQSFITNYQVDGYCNNFHQYENNVDTRHSVREVDDPRFVRQRYKVRNEPMDLPVPKFVIDEHSVSDLRNANANAVEGSTGLDLDTRIGLLIKSKALAGMHPIFSDLNDSEESESDLDDPFSSKIKSKFAIESAQIEMETSTRESFDDPEKPLSRPPSPFLSRATYLFWFNKAIEIKQQAKAQEQALLELAAKRLNQDTSNTVKASQMDRAHKNIVPKILMDEISKEIKEVMRREFIREVIEQTAFNTLDDWWEKQNKNEEDSSQIKLETGKNETQHDSLISNSKSQGSTSPKIPFPWEKDLKHQSEEGEDLKSSCCNKVANIEETSRVNQDDDINVSKARKAISSNSESQECHQPGVSKEIIFEVSKEECEVNYNIVSSMSGCSNDKLSESAVLNKSKNNCQVKVLEKENEASHTLPSDLNNSQEDDMEDKSVTVENILNLILNNMNSIIMQKNDNNTHKQIKQINKIDNLDHEMHSNLDTS